MAKENKIVAQLRTENGSANARRLRKTGVLPGVINMDGGGTKLLKFNRHDFEMMLRGHPSESLIVDLEIAGGKTIKALIKDIQRNSVTEQTMHVDLVEISMTKKMRVGIPLIFVGDPIGATQQGGILEQMLRELMVECLPSDLVEAIEVDVSKLELNHTILVENLQVDPKLTVLSDKKQAVAGVVEPRAEEEVAPEAAAVEGAAGEPEVIGKEKKEGEEGEEAEGEAKAKAGKAEAPAKGKEAAPKKDDKKSGK